MIFMLATILAAVLLVSAISFVGVLYLALREQLLKRLLLSFVSFAAGVLLGTAFLHLLPEVGPAGLGWALVGIIAFFLLERFIWHHCHRIGLHSFTYLNLVGDGLHNLADGAIIAASFLTSPPLGLAALIAVIAHEIPQEISDFAILIYGGFKRMKALLWNFVSALAAVAGALLVYFLSQAVADLTTGLLPFAAGGFIYIAATDLIPELHKETRPVGGLAQIGLLLAGVALMAGLTALHVH